MRQFRDVLTFSPSEVRHGQRDFGIEQHAPLWPQRDEGVAVLGCGVVNDARARLASDHLPLWVELEPRAQAAGLAAPQKGA